jgi:hypothetical protein
MTIPAGQETSTEAPSSRASLQIYLVPDARRNRAVKRILARFTRRRTRRD